MAAAPPPPPVMALPAVAFEQPIIHNALRNVNINVVDDDNVLRQERAYLMQNTSNPSQAYQKWPKPSIPLANEKGEILLCQVLLRDPSTSPQVVFVKSEITVVVKKLRRQQFDPQIQAQFDGTGPVVNDNPYNEISVMQQYGNEENIIQCHEALQDERYLYIVMPYLHQGDLYSNVQHGLGGGYQPAHEIPAVMTKLIKNLQYMESHGLVHRDLKPENIMVQDPWLPFIDFSMTLKAAEIEGNRQDLLPQGAAGSPSYISPEVFSDSPFNHKADIWALGCIFWHLLTGKRLYYIPTLTDDSYNFMIAIGGLTNQEWCDGALEHLLQHNPHHDLVPRLQAIQVLSPVARDLLSKLLQPNPNNRPTLQEILQHPFFHQPAPP